MASDEAIIFAACIQAASRHETISGVMSIARGLYASVWRETALRPLSELGKPDQATEVVCDALRRVGVGEHD